MERADLQKSIWVELNIRNLMKNWDFLQTFLPEPEPNYFNCKFSKFGEF